MEVMEVMFDSRTVRFVPYVTVVAYSSRYQVFVHVFVIDVFLETRDVFLVDCKVYSTSNLKIIMAFIKN